MGSVRNLLFTPVTDTKAFTYKDEKHQRNHKGTRMVSKIGERLKRITIKEVELKFRLNL